MTAMNGQRAIEHTLSPVIEGGWADHPSDNGGPTMRGITIGTYSKWLGRKATKAELKALSAATATLIYQRQYARHYVLAQMKDGLRKFDLPTGVEYRPSSQIVLEIARPNDISATLDAHIFKSLDGGELCGSY